MDRVVTDIKRANSRYNYYRALRNAYGTLRMFKFTVYFLFTAVNKLLAIAVKNQDIIWPLRWQMCQAIDRMKVYSVFCCYTAVLWTLNAKDMGLKIPYHSRID
jgi:hypothetical protein